MGTWLVDSHAHLDMAQFDADRDAVVERARQSGVAYIISIGTGRPGDGSVEKTLALAEKHDLVYAGIGVHPHDALHATEDYWKRMEGWAEHPKVVLWGEIGLDFYYEHSPRDVQMTVFRRQLEVARGLDLPISIHCRDAWDDIIRLLREAQSGRPYSGVFHSFTGTLEQARRCMDFGFSISFSGIVTFRNAGSLREAASQLPLDRVLLETDCPYLAPVPHRGKRNEPAWVLEVARCVAEARRLPLEEVARQASRNACRLLGLPEPSVDPS